MGVSAGLLDGTAGLRRDYISNLDTHADPAGLRRAKGWLSVGHDEYWSLSMFETHEDDGRRGPEPGVSLGQQHLRRDRHQSRERRPAQPDHRAGRAIWLAAEGRARERLSRGGIVHQERPERSDADGCSQHLSGDRRRRLDLPQARPLAVRRHRNEGRRRHPRPGRLGVARRPGADSWLEVVASGKTRSPRPNGEGTYTATIYPGPKGNFVFNAATIWWADGLSAPPGYIRPSVYTTPKGPIRAFSASRGTCSSGWCTGLSFGQLSVVSCQLSATVKGPGSSLRRRSSLRNGCRARARARGSARRRPRRAE